jgi:hypothetical protein
MKCEYYKAVQKAHQCNELIYCNGDIPGWHSVKDELPDKGKYNVVIKSDDGIDSETVDVLYFDGKDWIYEGEPTYCSTIYIEITHWQPLPAPPDRREG